MYKMLEVEIKVRDKIFGGLPKSQSTVESYVKAKFDSDDTSPTDTDLDLNEEIEKYTVGFRCDDFGIYIGSYQVKAMLKQTASLLDLTIKKRGSKQTLSEGTVIRGIDGENNLTGDKVYLLPIALEPTGIETLTGHVSTPQGKRDIMRNAEFVSEPTLKFQLWLLQNRIGDDNRSKKLTVSDVKLILAHGCEVGLGSMRSYAAGKFDVVKFEELGESSELQPEITDEVKQAIQDDITKARAESSEEAIGATGRTGKD